MKKIVPEGVKLVECGNAVIGLFVLRTPSHNFRNQNFIVKYLPV